MSAIRLTAPLVALLCVACSPPAEPAEDPPVEPQATGLRDAIQAPIEEARAVEGTVQDAADAQRAAIDAAGG